MPGVGGLMKKARVFLLPRMAGRVKGWLKAALMWAYCWGLCPAWTVTLAFRWFKLARA